MPLSITKVTTGYTHILLTGGYKSGTATSGGSSTITDSGASWTVNSLANRKVWIHTGTGLGQKRKIVSNTATVITVETAWATTPDATSQYMVSANFDDIQAADTAGGWGLITTSGINHKLSTTITIGDGTTGNRGYLADYSKNIDQADFMPAFTTSAYLTNTLFNVRGYSSFDDGFISDETLKTTYGGSNYVIQATTATVTLFFGAFTNSAGTADTVESFVSLNSTKVDNIRGVRNLSQIAQSSSLSNVWNAIFNLAEINSYGVDLFNVQLSQGLYGMTRVAGGFDKVSITGIISTGGTSGLALRTAYIGEVVETYNNPYIRNCTYIFGVLDNSGNIPTLNKYLVNADTDTWNMYFSAAVAASALSSKVYRQYEIDITVLDSLSAVVSGALVKMYDLASSEVVSQTTDGSGTIPTQTLNHGHYQGVTGNTEQMETPHLLKIRLYNYKFYELPISVDAALPLTFTLQDQTFITTTNVATVAAYTGISINYGTGVITVSGTRTIKELYDYLQYHNSLSANIVYDELLTTSDGINLVLAAGASINVTGSLTSYSEAISGTVTVASGGFYESLNGAQWNTAGTLYKASHFFINVKNVVTSANIQNAVVAFFNSTNVDVCYNTSRTQGALVSDASGNVEGYAVYYIGGTTDTSLQINIGEYNYLWLAIPTTVSGLAIGSSGSYSVSRLTSDTRVTLSKAAALAISGITVTGSTKTVDIASNTLTDAFDNLKARQTTTATIEAGIEGYKNHLLYGELLARDTSTYTAPTDWTYDNILSNESGILRDGIVTYGAAGIYTRGVYDATLKFSAASGTYDLRSASVTGSIELINTGGGSLTVQLYPTVTYVNTGPSITVDASVAGTITITGIPDAAGAYDRLQIINSTALSASAWAGTTAYAPGDIVNRSTGIGTENTAGLYMRCTTPGTSGGTEPTWDTTVGNTTADGTVVWTTCAILFYDADPSSTSYSGSYTSGIEFIDGESYEIRFAEMDAGTTFKTDDTSGIAGLVGFTVALSPVSDDSFSTNALDGSDYESTFSPNYTNDYIVLDTNTDFAGKAAYAYYCYLLTSTQGMYLFWGGITALDTGNYRINSSIVSMYFDESAGFVKQTDNVRFFRADGTRPAIDPTTGGSGIEINWRVPVNVVETTGSSVITGDIAEVTAKVQAGLTAQGYTTTRAPNLDNLDAAVSGVGGLDAAGVRAAIGMAAANMDTQLGSLATLPTLAEIVAGIESSKVGKYLLNKKITNSTGSIVEGVPPGQLAVFEDDGSTIAFKGALKKDPAGAIDYDGHGTERIEKLV